MSQLAGGRRLLQSSEQNVAINVTVDAPSANADDVADLLRSSSSSGALQQAIAAAGTRPGMDLRPGCHLRA